jgi:DNA invertase Pin-like site-specific DNA recombinase
MRLFGYARVSTSEQSLEIQKQKLINEGVKEFRILSDKSTGNNTKREGLQKLLDRVEQGDVVLVTKLDRLGRDTADMINLINQFNQMQVGVRFLEDGISTEGTTGKMVITILSAVAESERLRILERTNEGRLEAKLKGIRFGRKRRINRKRLIDRFKHDGVKGVALAREMGISRASVYKILREEGVISAVAESRHQISQ